MSRQNCRLISMSTSTTIRVTTEAREELRSLAEETGRTMTDELKALVRAERQRRMGAALAGPSDGTEAAWLDMAADEVHRATR